MGDLSRSTFSQPKILSERISYPYEAAIGMLEEQDSSPVVRLVFLELTTRARGYLGLIVDL